MKAAPQSRGGIGCREQVVLLVRGQLEAIGHDPIAWSDHWDPSLPALRPGGHRRLASSILAHRDMARARNAAAREAEARVVNKALQSAQVAAAHAAAVAAGGTPQGPRTRRAVPVDALPKKGDKVADVPALMRFWDTEANAAVGLDPTRLAAQSNKPCHWVCHEHEAGGPDGLWPGHTHRWEQSPNQRAMRGRAAGSARARPRARATACGRPTRAWPILTSGTPPTTGRA